MSGSGELQTKFKGVRRRKWGKWVSEIRVPGTQDRLWLGTYATPEAAAVAHDVAFVCLREKAAPEKLNFPMLVLPAGVGWGMSPEAVQKAASDAGMAVDARRHGDFRMPDVGDGRGRGEAAGEEQGDDQALSVSVEDYL
ncbi:unnamed protein product [Cuscuta campestris]|uniref:AP2/ERF domain-containing protein n=1 Tax=Cuscuta campestris TaxID=132261 RepID=A0A484L5A8_9ASTE|nr:unnamed protein product [Cuscuta campestris]